MKLLVLSEHDVERMLTFPECIAVMEDALSALARGEVHQPLRSIVRPADSPGFLGLMPAYRGGARPAWGLKEICLFPGNPARGLDTHLGAVILHSGETGEPLAIMNASAITAIRTAAVSALATKLLAREDASTLAIIGAGVQGHSHMKAIPVVREIREIRICSRTRAHADALARQASNARAVDSVHEAVRGADIIVTATSSKEPVVRREWIGAGIHINAVGSSVASSRELDSTTMAAASLFVDRRESTINESGDYLMAVRDGAITEDAIRAEIGDVLIGRARGRIAEDEITLFKSLGIAIEDLASAQFLYDKARATGAGSWVDF
ncbi:MAG: ornithine cyclodeaminase [Acidobacteria bacterium]|nr:MAG: ornithine cyclodeaminase [Acidobacteriota bacterium]